MSESFDDVITYAQAIMADCDTPILDRLKRAHDREVAEALCDACDQCDRMDKTAHEHEIEQMRKARFHEGYIAGQRSMDAEHYAVTLKLLRIRFDGGSHENLSKIAYAIYPCATGWTCESCDGLRDELIRLMGGVHECGADCGGCGACGADCDCGAGESGRVSYDELSQASVDAMSGRADEAYIEHEDGCLTLRDGLGGEMKFVKGDVIINGESLIESLVKNTEELSRQGKVRFPPNADGSLDGLKTVEETAALIDKVMKRRADQSHESSPMSQENEIGISDRTDEPDSQKSPILEDSDGEDGGKVTITADLQKSLREIAEHMGVPHDRDLTDYSDEAVIDAINWHIDSYYQINIDELQAQVIKCCKQRDKAREKAVNYRNLHHVTQRRLELERDNAKRQCDELQKKLDSARGAIRHVTNQWDISNKKRRELQIKLDAIRNVIGGTDG